MRNWIIQTVLGLLLLAFVIEILFIAPRKIGENRKSVNHNNESPKEEPGLDAKVEQMIRGFHLVETQNGQKEWQIKADKATSLKLQEPVVRLEKADVTFYGENEVTFKVLGEKGDVDVNSKDIWISGNVRMASSNGYRIRTEKVLYKSQERKLFAPGFVKLIGPDQAAGESLFLDGTGLLADLKTSTIDVQSKVKGEKTVKDQRRLKIQSDRATFSGQSNYAKFFGNVIMDVESLRVTGPEALFQYDSSSGSLDRVEVEGGVRVSDMEKLATSDRLTVNFKEDQFIFRGRPKIIQNQDELFGDQIVFLEGGKRVRVLGARARMDEDNLEKK